MRGIKPFKLGFITRPFQWGHDHFLGIAVLGYFPLDAEPTLLTDMELWSEVPELLGEIPLDTGIPKSRSEFLVTGSAFQENGEPGPVRQVRVKVGELDKQLYTIGDRVWRKGVPTEPVPFVEMPIDWAHAFGGEGFDKNPLGKGYGEVEVDEGDDVRPLPNVEAPGHLIDARRDRPDPASFGPIDFTWPQRFELTGTYDKKWLETRFPGFAEDLDWRVWNMTAPDQQQEEPFRGDEAVLIEHMHPTKPRLEGRLPSIHARAFVDQKVGEEEKVFTEVPLKLTTIWLFPGLERGVLVWHGAHKVATDDADDVENLMIAGERIGAEPRTQAHYEAVLEKRLGPDRMFECFKDSDLMPADLADMGQAVEEQTKLTTLEQRRYKRQRAVADRKIEETRERLREMGLDPDEHGPQPLDDAPEVPSSMEGLAKLLEETLAEAEKRKAEAEAHQERSREELVAFCEKMGRDPDELLAEIEDGHRGPPTWTALGQRMELQAMAAHLEAQGQPVAEVEHLANDPERFEDWEQAERALGDGYLRTAHLQSPAYALSAEDSKEKRAALELALREGRPVAWWDLTGTNLSGIDLTGVDLSRAFMESVDLTGAKLDGANLRKVVLANATLKGASLVGANLEEANLGRASFEEANLEGANLAEVTLNGVVLRGARLAGANMRESRFDGATLEGAVFDGTNLSHTTFQDMVLRDVDFRGADLTQALFMKSDTSGLDFSGGVLRDTTFLESTANECRFVNADMTGFRALQSSFEGSDFKGATLDKASMREARMRKCDLSGAKLNSSDLSKADLTEAKLYRIVARRSMWMRTCFRHAMMVSADLFEAILSKADLRGADLRGANLYGSDFSLVWSDEHTNLTDSIQDRARYLPLREQP